MMFGMQFELPGTIWRIFYKERDLIVNFKELRPIFIIVRGLYLKNGFIYLFTGLMGHWMKDMAFELRKEALRCVQRHDLGLWAFRIRIGLQDLDIGL